MQIPDPSEPTYCREDNLRKRLNSFLTLNFNLPDNDYYASLNAEAILGLKALLSDINNILTLKVTLAFVDWLAIQFNLTNEIALELKTRTMGSKPNTNGFDVWLNGPIALVGEVKCNIPINGGYIYGSAQRKGIEKDITALLNGKTKSKIIPTSSFKYMAFLDSENIRKANEHLVRVSSVCRDKLIFVSSETKFDSFDMVYCVYLNP